jgi:hypothetical protein
MYLVDGAEGSKLIKTHHRNAGHFIKGRGPSKRFPLASRSSAALMIKKQAAQGGGIERPGWRSPPGRRVNSDLHRRVVRPGGRGCGLIRTHSIGHQADIDAAVVGPASGGLVRLHRLILA